MLPDEGSSPPPPTTPAPPLPAAPAKVEDNSIALAGMMVSVLGIILSMVVIGGFIGLAGIGLCAVGLKRSRSREGKGKGMAIGGIVLGLIAIGLSVLGFFWVRALLDTGDTTVIDGITSNTGSDEFPPQEDFDRIDCTESNTGLLSQATVTITNRSDGKSSYTVTVVWDTEDEATVSKSFSTDVLDPGETDSFDALDLSGAGLVDSCRVTVIDRPSFSFLPQ